MWFNCVKCIVLKYFIIGVLTGISFSCLFAQEPGNRTDTLFLDQDIFDSDSIINCSLTFDIRKFRKEKYKEEKIPAILSFHKNDSLTIHKEIQIEARGESRKKICYMPPIKLKLKKTSFEDPYLNRVKNQKWVTHCNTSKDSEQILLKEYLVYKLYNLITERSFRVKLLNVNYVDSKGKVKTISRHAFLIEHKDIMAERNKCTVFDRENLGMGHVDTASMVQLSLFQYMVGNVDWSISGLHNIKLIKSLDYTQKYPFAVPYDFDFSGFVDASYAFNVLDQDVASVKTRMFVGICSSEDDYLEIIQRFISLKEEIYATINNFNLLESKHKTEILQYMDDFFRQIDMPHFYDRHISISCKNYNN